MVKYRDIYGYPVSLELNGSEAFPTSIGTICTILTGLFIVVYLAGNIRSVIRREHELTANLNKLNEYSPMVYEDGFSVSQ